MRDEVEPPDLGPAAGLLAQPLDERAGLLEEDPEQHRRARAGDRRAERAELARLAAPAPSSAGRGARARGWCRRSSRPRAISARSRAREPERRAATACATLKVASASGTSAGSAARASAVGTGSRRDHRDRLEAGRRLERRHVRRRRRSRSRRRARPRRCRDGPRSRAARSKISSRGSASSYMWSAATQRGDDRRAARAEARRERDLGADPEREAVDLVQVGEGPHAEVASRPPAAPARRRRPRTRPVSSTSSSRCSETAAAIASKPGPRFADEPGTRTRRRRPISPEHRPLDLARGRGRRRSRRGACSKRGVGVLQPVAGEHADEQRPLGRVLQRRRPRRRPRPARRRRPRSRRASAAPRGSRRR